MLPIRIRSFHGCGTRFCAVPDIQCRRLTSAAYTARTVQVVGPGRAGLAQQRALPQSRGRRHSSQLSKPPNDPTQLLPQQRLRRPVSPPLSIYRPQATWVVSIATRITGIALSGGLYLYETAYLLSPVAGWDIGSESLVSAFSSLSPPAQFALKFAIALPFVFHSSNGVRHLVWDTGRMLTNKQVARSGWIVIGASGVVALLGLWTPRDDS